MCSSPGVQGGSWSYAQKSSSSQKYLGVIYIMTGAHRRILELFTLFLDLTGVSLSGLNYSWNSRSIREYHGVSLASHGSHWRSGTQAGNSRTPLHFRDAFFTHWVIFFSSLITSLKLQVWVHHMSLFIHMELRFYRGTWL
jgi:hypothetical protein